MISYKRTGWRTDVIVGLSTETKPTDVENGYRFCEIDTGYMFAFDAEHSQWHKLPGSSVDEDEVRAIIDDATAELQAELDEAISGATEDSEVINARVTSDGTTYSTLKARLDAENTELKNAISDVDDRLTPLDGKIVAEWEIGQRYVNNGQDTLANTSTRIRTKAGTYLQFKSGEIIALKNLQEYQFYIGYSTDGGSTFQTTGNREELYTFATDAVGFLCVTKKTGTFTESEMNDVANNKIIYIIPNTDLVHKNSDSIDALTLGNANFGGFDLIVSKSGIATLWITAGLTDYFSTKYCDAIPVSKGDVFLISAEESVSYPSLFTSIGLIVIETNSNGASVQRTYLTDISSPVKYIVQNANTTYFQIFGNLKAESTSVTTGYRETFEYKLNVLKQLSASGIDELLTEAGDTWEV